jgi:hypothetical protein
MSVAGTYNCVTHTPMGDQTFVFTVNPDGDTFTGTNSGQMGSMDVENGKVDGNTLIWQMKITVPMPMTLDCTATVDGDAMTGKVTAGMFGTFPMEGTRA